jgi:hypothetical protein
MSDWMSKSTKCVPPDGRFNRVLIDVLTSLLMEEMRNYTRDFILLSQNMIIYNYYEHNGFKYHTSWTRLETSTTLYTLYTHL